MTTAKHEADIEIDWQNPQQRDAVFELLGQAVRCPSCGRRSEWRIDSPLDEYPLRVVCGNCEYASDARIFKR